VLCFYLVLTPGIYTTGGIKIIIISNFISNHMVVTSEAVENHENQEGFAAAQNHVTCMGSWEGKVWFN